MNPWLHRPLGSIQGLRARLLCRGLLRQAGVVAGIDGIDPARGIGELFHVFGPRARFLPHLFNGPFDLVESLSVHLFDVSLVDEPGVEQTLLEKGQAIGFVARGEPLEEEWP